MVLKKNATLARDERRAELPKLLAQGYTVTSIAKHYSVGRTTIHNDIKWIKQQEQNNEK